MNQLKYGVLLLLMMVAVSSCSPKTAEEAKSNPDAADAAPTAAAEAPAAAANSAPAKSPESAAPSRASAPAKAAPDEAKPAPRPAPEPPRTVEVPSGTELEVVLLDALNSGKNQAGDQFLTSLAAPVVVRGVTVIEKGTKIQGRVVDAEGSGRVKGRASMRLVLTGVVQGDKVVSIVTNTFFTEAEGTKGRDAGIIGGGAGIGAAIGAIAGGKKGAATGAIIGGAAGTGTVLATKGKEVEFEPEARLKFTLEKPVQMLPAAKRNT